MGRASFDMKQSFYDTGGDTVTELSARVASKYLDVHAVADQLGVSVQTIYRWRSEGFDMPVGFLVGSRVRWRQETVDLWIAVQEAKALTA